ncbi:MAG: hypothetical protein ACE15C_08165 [Phycisphaerae bacterium]
MTRKHAAVAIAVILLVCCCVCAATSAPTTASAPAATQAALAYLAKAEQAARKLPTENGDKFPSNPRELALQELALLYAEAGDSAKAESIASELGDAGRLTTVTFVCIALADKGKVNEALGIVRKAKQDRLLASFALALTRQDIPMALKLAPEIPDDRRAQFYCAVVRNSVLKNETKLAEEMVPKVTRLSELDEAYVSESSSWIAAGRIVASSDMRKAMAASTQPAGSLESYLAKILRARVEAGETKQSSDILDLLTDPASRVLAMAEIARCYAAKRDAQDCRQLIAQGLKEAAAVKDASEIDKLKLVGFYLSAPDSLARVGDIEEGLKIVKEARIHSEKGELSVFAALGGTNALIRLYASAGKMDEAVRLATREDGTLSPDALTILIDGFMRAGMAERAAELTEKANSDEQRFRLNSDAARAALDTGSKR